MKFHLTGHSARQYGRKLHLFYMAICLRKENDRVCVWSYAMDISPAHFSLPLIADIQYQANELSRGFRPEGASDWLMVTTLQGFGYVKADGRSWTLSRGQGLLISPHTPQEYGYRDEQGEWSNIWVHFRPRAHWMPWLQWPQTSKGIMILEVPIIDSLEVELRKMVELSQGPRRLASDAAMNSLERVLLELDEVNPNHYGFLMDPRIRRALEIVGERLAEPIIVDDLSRQVGLSRSRFSVLFSHHLNCSPQVYIEVTRLQRAAQMLQSSSWTIGQIAIDVGFSNSFYFSTRFRRHFGLTPSDYRSAKWGSKQDI
jgi:AraC family transcriptional regulator of arabinose operon